MQVAVPASRSGVEETRVRIFHAARALYAAKGSRGTTTRELAIRAGVNEATIFRHFGTKRQLIEEMLEYFNRSNSIPEILAELDVAEPIARQLATLAHAGIAVLRLKEDLIRVALAEAMPTPEVEPCAWRPAFAARASLRRYFSDRIAAGDLRGDPNTLTRAFMSFVFTYVIARTFDDDLTTTQETAVTDMVDLFLAGAAPR